MSALPLLTYIEHKDRGTVYPRTYHILEYFEETRSDDKKLYRRYADAYHNGNLLACPPFESIARRRREIQNRDGLFLPTGEVQGRRKSIAEVNRRMFS